MFVFVILPAAGIGTRMAPPGAHSGTHPGASPKQFLSLAGSPILIHSLRAFLAVPRVTAIYVAVRESEHSRVAELIAEHNLGDNDISDGCVLQQVHLQISSMPSPSVVCPSELSHKENTREQKESPPKNKLLAFFSQLRQVSLLQFAL